MLKKTRMQSASSEKYTSQWYTPQWIVEKIRRVYGGVIDLDPATDETAQQVVKAAKYYTSDGLNQPWYGNVYLNYPGGVTGNVSNSTIWLPKAEKEFVYGRSENIIICIFSLDHLCLNPFVLAYPILFLRDRVKFWGQNASHPSHQNALVLMHNDKFVLKAFKQEFNGYGEIYQGVKL